MFRFEHPEYFIAFAVIPVVFGLYLLMRFLSGRDMRSFASDSARQRIFSRLSKKSVTASVILLFLALFMLCTALVNPQWGLRRETVQAKSADIFIALDISNSMSARDIAPSRLERAKKFAQDLVEEFKGDRIGLILFAGNAYLQMPLTCP